jgi:hypothetical protein
MAQNNILFYENLIFYYYKTQIERIIIPEQIFLFKKVFE